MTSTTVAAAVDDGLDDLRTRPVGTEGRSSRCYRRAVAVPVVEPVPLSSPAHLFALDSLHPLKLPAETWVVEGREFEPRFDYELPKVAA